jgi:hypothetical protein
MIRRRIIPIVLIAGTATGALMAPAIASADPVKTCSTSTNNQGNGKGITTTQTQTSACNSNSDTGSTTTRTNPAGHTPGG